MNRSTRPVQPAPRDEPRAPSRRLGRGALALLGLVLLLVGLGTKLAITWRHQQVLARIDASLPPRPESKTLPVQFTDRLDRATQEATTDATVFQGVAELGRLYHASGFRPQAESCWQILMAAQPKEARWGYYLSDLRRLASDYTTVAELLVRTTELAPAYAPAWLQMAALQFKSGQLEEAQRSYRQRLGLLPHDPYARLGLIRVALQQGQRKQAREQMEQLVKETPDFSPGHNLYAEMLAADGDTQGAGQQRWLGRESGRFREADDPWLDELGNWCFDYEQLCIRGTVDFQTRHGDRGKHYFERAIELRPEKLLAHSLLGAMYLELNEPGKARDILEAGLQRTGSTNPTVLYYVDLSRAYRDLKKPAEAVRIIREGLTRLGPQFELYDALGVSLGDSGEREAAVEALHTAIGLNPDDPNSNYNLALALLNVRRLEEAVAALQRSLVSKPTFPASLALLSQIEIDSGRWESSLQYLQPLFASHPEMPQARLLMGYCELQAGIKAENQNDLVAAEKHYREGITLDHNRPDLAARLGTLCLIQGRFAEAVEPLEAYHRLQPDNVQSSLFLGQAYAAVGRSAEARKILTAGAELADRTGNATTAEHCREILLHLP